MSGCIIPGSFDPITRGHMNMIERASRLYDTVHVAVMVNIAKDGKIPYEDRVGIIRKACSKIPNVHVMLWKGLLSDFARQNPGNVVIRSVRNTGEFEHEIMNAEINRRLYPEMETLLLPAEAEWAEVSSSAVREIAAVGGDIRNLVPDIVYWDIVKLIAKKP